MYLDTAANWKIVQWPKLGQFEQEKKVLLDHNPKGKINIHGSTLINTQASKKASKQGRTASLPMQKNSRDYVAPIL